MRISSTLFSCIKYELDIISFPIINMHSVRGKRQWKRYSPEKKACICKKMSKSAESSPKNVKKRILMQKGMKKYWKGLSKAKKEAHIATMSKGMKKAWDESDENFKPRLSVTDVHNILKKRLQIEHDVPRINIYSGVITESQMEEINV